MKKVLLAIIFLLIGLAISADVYCVIFEAPSNTPQWEGFAIWGAWAVLILLAKWFYLNGSHD